MAVESQQGGDAYFHLGSQPDDDTLVDDIQKLSRIKRAFVEHSLEPSGELRRSDSIRGSVFPGKSQSGKIGGTARIVTEVFRNNMLEYVQGILNADPETESDDIADTEVYATASATFVATTDLVLQTVDPGGSAGTGQILLDSQPTTPSRIRITVAGADDDTVIEIVGKRKYGLGRYDLAPVTEEVTDLVSGVASLSVNSFHTVDKITIFGPDTTLTPNRVGHGLTGAANLTIEAFPELRSTLFKARSSIFTGWSMESQIGKESRIGLTVVPSSAQFNVSDTIRLSIDMLARAVYPRRTIEGGVFDEKLTNDSDIVNDSFGDSEFFTDYGGCLLIYDGATSDKEDRDNPDLVIFDSYDLTYNPGLQYRTGKDGSRIQSGIERADAGATITGNVVVNFETGDDPADDFFKWDEHYRDNVLSTVELFTFFWTDTGKEYYHRIKLPNVQLTANSETPVSSRGTIKRTLAIEAVVDNEEDVVEWEIADDHGWYGALPVITRTGAASVGNGASVTVTVTWTKDVRNFQNGDVDVTPGTKGAFNKVSDSVYTSALTTPATGAGNMIFTIAENGTREGNPERSLVIPYA